MGILLKIHPDTPQERLIRQAVDVLENDGVIIYPTDSVYALGCSMKSKKALERLAKFKGINLSKARFSFICRDIADISDYTMTFPTSVFKLIKRNTPGPFTFILEASRKIPKMFENSQKTVGLRIPDSKILHAIVKELGNPILTTSIKDNDDQILEYITDPELLWEKFKNQVDLIIDGGYGNNVPTAIIDLSSGQPEILREGIQELIY